jgi:hypothetical protein
VSRTLIHLMTTQDRLIAMTYEVEDLNRRFIAAGISPMTYNIREIKESLAEMQERICVELESYLE